MASNPERRAASRSEPIAPVLHTRIVHMVNPLTVYNLKALFGVEGARWSAARGDEFDDGQVLGEDHAAEALPALHEALADPATRDEALEIARGLVERVRVKPGKARGSFEVELEGEIAALVELRRAAAENNKKAAR